MTCFFIASSRVLTPVSRRTTTVVFWPNTRPSQVNLFVLYFTFSGRRSSDTIDISGGISR